MKFLSSLAAFAVLASQLGADFRTDFREAMQALVKVKDAAEKPVVEGKLSEANKVLYDVFPEAKRTPVEAFAIANMIFKQDHKMSYKLHKQAAEAFPTEAHVQYEWGLDQHRAGEYAGAAESYAIFSKANPNFAPVLGLTAECLLRAGKTKEALKVWKESEAAPSGTLEALESLVCEVHSHKMQDADREAYLIKAKTGDIDAAEKLIVLDCKFEHDWWNDDVRDDYLHLDIPALKEINFKDKDRAHEIIAMGEVAIAAKKGATEVRQSLQSNEFIVVTPRRFPKTPIVASSILHSLDSADIILFIKSDEKKWIADLMEQSKTSKDPELFNVLAHLHLKYNKNELFDIQKRGWEQTGDERFAASYIIALFAKGGLKLDNPELTKALKAFPENAFLCRVVLELREKEGKSLEEPLIAAIKAEYSHFSLQPPFNLRIGSANLRRYWAKLEKVLAEKK